MGETPFLTSQRLQLCSADSQTNFYKCDECGDRNRVLQKYLEETYTPNWRSRKAPRKRQHLNCMLNNRYNKEMSRAIRLPLSLTYIQTGSYQRWRGKQYEKCVLVSFLFFLFFFFFSFSLNKLNFGGARVAQLVKHLSLDFSSGQVMTSQFVSLSPTLGSLLTVWSLLGILSPSPPLSLSLCSSPAHAPVPTHTLSLKNKLQKIKS